MAEEKSNVVPGVFGSIDEMLETGVNEVEYAEVEGLKPGGKKARIGSVNAGDMIEWSEGNDRGGEEKKTAGLRLIAKSLVDDKGVRYAMADLAATIRKLRTVRHKECERIVRAILKLNGMSLKADDASKKD